MIDIQKKNNLVTENSPDTNFHRAAEHLAETSAVRLAIKNNIKLREKDVNKVKSNWRLSNARHLLESVEKPKSESCVGWKVKNWKIESRSIIFVILFLLSLL